MKIPLLVPLGWALCVGAALASGCSSKGSGAGPKDANASGDGDDASMDDASDDSADGEGGMQFTDGGLTCAQTGDSYVGCEYDAVPVANVVWSVFDFAVVVANAGVERADITVQRGGQMVATASVDPNAIAKIYLPWIPELKGKDADMCGTVVAPLTASAHVKNGAYHIQSSIPVTVYQFNAIEYEGIGGPQTKDWSNCPGNIGCNGVGCYSYSNDASILLPTNAWTGHYRVASTSSLNSGGTYFAITALKDNTHVTVKLSSLGKVTGGGGIPDTAPGGTLTITMAADDTVQIAGPTGITDFSGSLVTADQPVQVIAGHPCRYVPGDPSTPACDHLETNNVPAETLGKHYFVEQPTGPYGGLPGAVVRIYGNADGTKLTYPQGAPPMAPSTLNAGDVVDLGTVTQDFEVSGDHEFAVVSLMLGGSAVDPQTGEGDPSMSMMVPVEQYRGKYVFLAPDDYDISYADVVEPMGAMINLDGQLVSVMPTPIGSSGYGVARIKLSRSSNHGAHVLAANQPVGLQVLGYGKYTSYQYPGGLNLGKIAPPPPK
jgi:hypothetical protein